MRSNLTYTDSFQPETLVKTNDGPLLDAYNPLKDIYFSSNSCTLLAKPPFANLLVTDSQPIAKQAQLSLRFARELGFTDPLVIGAINFDADNSSYLRVCTQVKSDYGHQHHDYFTEKDLDTISDALPDTEQYPEPAAFAGSVREALTLFAKGELEKVVLSRTLKIRYPHAPDAKTLVRNLAIKNRNGYTYAINLNSILDCNSDIGTNKVHALVGASPELLIAKKGNRIFAHPLAGSEARTHILEVDRKSEQQLLTSEKDLYEHRLVIDAIKNALTPFCHSLSIPANPCIVRTPTMLHLGTYIGGELNDSELTSLDLAQALHPTPAVCGYPADKAKLAIKELESHERNLFTGMVGWCSENGDGEWAVTIRCAEIMDNNITVFAGAGIVKGSCPHKETRETAAKFNTMLNAMGVVQP